MKKLKIDFKKMLTVFVNHPAITIMLAYSFILLAFNATSDWNDTSKLIDEMIKPVTLLPFCLVASLVIDKYASKYKFPLDFIILVIFGYGVKIPGIENWINEFCYGIVAGVVMPICILIYKLNLRNQPFSKSTVNTVWALPISLFVGGLIFLLLGGIYWSLQLLFDLKSSELVSYLILFFSFIFTAPAFFIYQLDRDEEDEGLAKIFRVISEYIVTPALLVYTAILLAYIAKILLTWELPHGGAAIMCFIWALVFFYIRMADQSLGFKHLKWVSHLRWAAIPIMLLLWVAVGRRICDYGYTSGRYFLVICGIMSTLYTILEILKAEKGYFIIAATGALIFLGGVIVPGLNYKSISIRSQSRRIEKLLESRDSLSQEQVSSLRSSWKMIEEMDTLRLSELSITKAELYEITSYEQKPKDVLLTTREVQIEGYRILKKLVYRDEKDGILSLDGQKYDLREIFQEQLRDSGLEPPFTEEKLKSVQDKLLVYEVGDIRMVWESRHLSVDKDGNCSLSWTSIPNFVLCK